MIISSISPTIILTAVAQRVKANKFYLTPPFWKPSIGKCISAHGPQQKDNSNTDIVSFAPDGTEIGIALGENSDGVIDLPGTTIFLILAKKSWGKMYLRDTTNALINNVVYYEHTANVNGLQILEPYPENPFLFLGQYSKESGFDSFISEFKLTPPHSLVESTTKAGAFPVGKVHQIFMEDGVSRFTWSLGWQDETDYMATSNS
jgi:hypothetical protein